MLDGDWKQTAIELPSGTWTNRLTGASIAGGKLSVKELLLDFPVALLARGGTSGDV
jgi:(1->4)-alpha-D-glucan 1-alpha-D-glucosylmutase